MRKILRTQEFTDGLNQIADYINDKFGIDYIEKFLVNTDQALRTLAMFPETGWVSVRNIYTRHIGRKNWVYYNFTDDEIIFLFIHDARIKFDKSKLNKK